MSLSLRDLSERSGVSAQMLSQVERGETSPTIAVAERIAAGLELTLSQLLRLDEGDGVNVVRCGERRDGGTAAYGHRFECSRHRFLAPRRAVGALPRAGRLHRPHGDPPIHEAGSRETAVVTEGELRLVCDGAPYDLAKGDCVTFDADLPHHFENQGDEDARFYAIVSAGLEEKLTMPKTLFDKIWEAHEVVPGLLYIDLHLVHEVTSAQAFEGLRLAGREVRRPDRTLATADHNVPTDGSTAAARSPTSSREPGRGARGQLRRVRRPALLDGLARQGIVHVIGPELGVTQPGMTIVCGDSPHRHPRRVRRAGVRDRHQRGGARVRHPDAAPARSQSRC